MLTFFIGCVVGCTIGVIAMAFCNAASKADEDMNR